MGSGYFPISKMDEDGKRLMKAVVLVEEVKSELLDAIYDGDDGQFDNAASDGGSLARLGVAIDLIKGEVV